MVYLFAVLLWMSVPFAEQRPPAEATQHALDELANAVAQGKITLTPTPVPTSTPMPVPTATPIPAPSNTAQPEATPIPSLPSTVEQGYTRGWNDPWVELALPEGRWNVLTTCEQSLGWHPVWLFQQDGQPALSTDTDVCSIGFAQWSSDSPCSMDENGICSLADDTSYWDWVGNQPTPEPDPPTSTPIPTMIPTVRAPQAAAALAPVAPPQPQTVYVQSTPQVIVREVLVTNTPAPTHTVTLTSTPTVTRTPSLTPTPTVQPTRTPTPTQIAIINAVSKSTNTTESWITTPLGIAVLVGIIIFGCGVVILVAHLLTSR